MGGWGERGEGRVELVQVNFFNKESKSKKLYIFYCGEGGEGGARVSGFFLQRILIKYFFLWGGGMGGEVGG